MTPAVSDAIAIEIPTHIQTLDDFRAWADSDDYPQRGRFAFINGQLWADLEMERIFSHNQPKGKIATTLEQIVTAEEGGLYMHDRVLLTNEDVGISTEPDGIYITYAAIKSGRVVSVTTVDQLDVKEYVGSPDMVLEVVSASSVVKDTVDLMAAYFRAGIAEYWLVDARAEPHQFDIYIPGESAYEPTPSDDGWLWSAVFGRSFRLTAKLNPIGQRQFTLEVSKR